MFDLVSHQGHAGQATGRCHFSLARAAEVETGKEDVSVSTWRNRAPRALLVGVSSGAAAVKSGPAVPQKIRISSYMTQKFHSFIYNLVQEIREPLFTQKLVCDHIHSGIIHSGQKSDNNSNVHQLTNGFFKGWSIHAVRMAAWHTPRPERTWGAWC